MSNSTTTSPCNPQDRLCLIQAYQVEIIVIPALLLSASFLILLSLCFLWLCRKNDGEEMVQHRKQRLQGIDAPPELNPLEHEAVPMTVQRQNNNNKRSTQTAESQLSTERQTWSFEQISPLSLSFTVKPDNKVTLYQATVDQKPVVLRVLNESVDSREQQDFLGFANFLTELGSHLCLPRLLGVIRQGSPLIIIMERLENRDLLGFLWRCRKVQPGVAEPCAITERMLVSMARQIASALDYLHSKNCVHGNIGARSVLVGRDLSVKLWGLGPAYRRRMKVRTSGEVTEIETRKWQAPEVLARQPVSKSSDVWSFGVLLYEMVTLGEPPFPNVMARDLMQYLQRGKNLKKPSNCSNTLYSIIKACCHWRPQDRAPMNKVISMLQAAEHHANDTVILQASEPLDMEKYMQEAGYGEAYNFAVL